MNLKLTTPPDTDHAKPETRWSLLYSIALGELVLLIVLFYLFTKAFE